MAFDFASKNRTYEAALTRTKACLQEDDRENGAMYLRKAIELADELSRFSSIEEFRVRFAGEKAKLLKIEQLLAKGENPFLKKVAVDSSPNKA